ncbi:hypothetical protein H5410_027758, partial [Solanum commersonii]
YVVGQDPVGYLKLSIKGTNKFKDKITDRIVIDLVENEFNCEKADSYQDKIAKIEKSGENGTIN